MMITANCRAWLLLTALLCTLPTYAAGAVFEEGDALYVHTSLYTRHFSPDPEHNNNQHLLNIEYLKPSNWVFGVALFKNSHFQSTQFVYAGRRWALPAINEHVYFKLVGGLQHGYRGEHQDDVPFNHYGISPIILPALGIQYKQVQTEVIFFGAGFTWTAGVNFKFGE